MDSQSTSKWDEVVTNFDDMGLKDKLLNAIYAYGFEKPSEIQQRAIMPSIKGYDMIIQDESGEERIAIFAIGILEQIDTSINMCQALILTPTRDLAQQIQKVVLALGDYLNAQCYACFEDTNFREDVRNLEIGVHVVVGTPKRISDLVSKRAFSMDQIKIFVLDEADEILFKGFGDEIYNVFHSLNPGIQVISLSASVTSDLIKLTDDLMTKPIKILDEND